MGTQDVETRPPSVRRMAKCHTEGCPAAAAEPCEAVLYENVGEPKYIAVCGQCGEIITDLTEVPSIS